MKKKRIGILVIAITILFALSNCGLKKQYDLKKKFETYPHLEDDKVVDFYRFSGRGVVDTGLIVRNKERYYLIRMDGSREEVRRYRKAGKY